jgi:hypothetical protein
MINFVTILNNGNFVQNKLKFKRDFMTFYASYLQTTTQKILRKRGFKKMKEQVDHGPEVLHKFSLE